MSKRTEYYSQVKVNTFNPVTQRVTGHVILTRGAWIIPAFGEKEPLLGEAHPEGERVPFCMASVKAPQGLPLVDESTPIGSPAFI
jgi:hypothetical protein